MSHDFKQLAKPTSHTAGIVSFCLLGIVCCLAARFVYVSIDGVDYLGVALAGVVIGACYLIVLWLTLAPPRLIRRLPLAITSSLVLCSAWMLGFSTTFDRAVGVRWLAYEEFYFLGFLPTVMCAAALPLLGIRWFGNRVIASMFESAPEPQRTTTGDYLTVMAVIAFVLAAIQLPRSFGYTSEMIGFILGMMSAWMFGASLIVVMPMVLVLLSRKFDFATWSWVILAILAGLIMAGLSMFSMARVGRVGTEFVGVPATIIFSAMAVFYWGILSTRLMGYRLVRRESVKLSQK